VRRSGDGGGRTGRKVNGADVDGGQMASTVCKDGFEKQCAREEPRTVYAKELVNCFRDEDCTCTVAVTVTSVSPQSTSYWRAVTSSTVLEIVGKVIPKLLATTIP